MLVPEADSEEEEIAGGTKESNMYEQSHSVGEVSEQANLDTKIQGANLFHKSKTYAMNQPLPDRSISGGDLSAFGQSYSDE